MQSNASERTTVFNWGKILTEEQVLLIEEAASSLQLDNSTVGEAGCTPEPELRVTKTGFFNRKEHKNLFTLGDILINNANAEFHGFHIDSISDIQYGEYGAGGHYNWHTDINWSSPLSFDRKITAIIILSDTSEYKGGSLDFMDTHVQGVVGTDLERGMVITFPSYIYHKVHKVTEGLRRTVVIWASGPKFT